MNLPAHRLAVEALDLMDRESQLIESMIDQMNELRTAIIRRDSKGLGNVAEMLLQTQTQRQDLAALSQGVWRKTARYCGLGESAGSVRHLMRIVDEDMQKRLDRNRTSLLALAAKAARINFANLSLMSHFSQLTQQVIEALTGKPTVVRYAKTGQLDTRQAVSTFQTDY